MSGQILVVVLVLTYLIVSILFGCWVHTKIIKPTDDIFAKAGMRGVAIAVGLSWPALLVPAILAGVVSPLSILFTSLAYLFVYDDPKGGVAQ
jgi:hypothetical protein